MQMAFPLNINDYRDILAPILNKVYLEAFILETSKHLTLIPKEDRDTNIDP